MRLLLFLSAGMLVAVLIAGGVTWFGAMAALSWLTSWLPCPAEDDRWVQATRSGRASSLGGSLDAGILEGCHLQAQHVRRGRELAPPDLSWTLMPRRSPA